MKKLYLGFLQLIILACVTAQDFESSQKDVSSTSFPFDNIGEELEYSLKWGFLKVGSGYLRVFPVTSIDGEECYHVQLQVESNSVADSFYKVRNRFDSYISKTKLLPVKYLISQHEGDTHREAEVVFNWNDKTVVYQREGEEEKEPVEIQTETWDPLSVVYSFRKVLDLTEKTTVLPTTDGKKFLMIDVEYLGLEDLETQLGNFNSIKIQPNTKELKGVFQKSKKSKITMWYSNDQNRYPLLIKSKVIVGSFNAELKKIRSLVFSDSEG